MTRSVRWLIPVGAVLLLGLAACGGGSTDGGDQPGDAVAVEESSGRVGSYPLHFRRPFPELNVYALDGNKVDASTLVKGKDSVVLFVSTSCGVCAELIDSWKSLSYQIPDTVNVIAIVDEELEFAREWADLDQFPFPLYVDTRSAFALRHGIEHYPTAVGVDPDGVILYVRRGVSEMFTPFRAANLLHRGAEELLKRTGADGESEMDGEGDLEGDSDG